MWQLETNRPNFLPRLGGPLVGLLHNPADPALLLIRQADNTIRVVNTATMKVECSILGVRPRPPSLSAPAAAAATCLQPRAGLLVLPTSNAMLQLFDVHRHRHVALLQMAPRNMVAPTASSTSGTAQPLGSDTDMTDAQYLAEAGTPHGLDGGVLEPCVVHSVFSGDGKTLATVEIRPDAGPYGSSEAALRFWDGNSAAPRSGAPVPFVLNTRVDEPHRGGVTSIAYHPSRELVATTGGCHDPVSAGASAALEGHQGPCELKIWERIAAPKRPGSKAESPTCWRCRSVASHKGQPLSAAAFSPDGSLLAVAAGPKATLWEPAHSTCVCTLPSPPELLGPYAPPLQRLVYVPGTPFLVGSTGSSLTVWNMLTCSVHWSSPLRTCSLAADPHHPYFAVSVPLGGKRLHQHGMASSHPLQGVAEATPAGNGASKEKQQQQQKQQQEGGEGADARGVDGVRSPDRKRRGSGRANTGDTLPPSQQQQQTEGERATADADGGTHVVGSRSMPGTPHQQQQQQHRARPSPPSCFVVVFDPAHPTPLMVAHVPNTSHTALLFVQSDMPQHMEHAAAPRDGSEGQQQQHGHPLLISPLLVVTEDRGYAYVGHEGSLGSVSQQHKRQQQQQHKRIQAPGGEGVSAFEAAFGAAAVARKQQHGEQDGGMEVDEDSSQPRWRQLFDAPSHALPAPMDLAASFLQLITSDLGKEE
ncbi:hypothetical protein DUNSADRAFT_15275 [Dunaliella salina]|nr:hypothetical protein DUNSADRAFT_15275 [Dunaliella salina]|eukprot:KAF5829957.1 hypothetical protein DUNSADRAFT_15275 [Dunaliella salina]